MRDSGKKREEVFLSTKLWPSEYENPNAVDETLERLGVDYVDLLYIHQPAGNWLAGYRQIEKAYKEGKASFERKVGKGAKAALTAVFLLISAYGVYAFIKRGIGDYLLMKVMFAFFDFGEARIRFLLDYVSVMVLVASIGYYLQSVLLNKHKKGKEA